MKPCPKCEGGMRAGNAPYCKPCHAEYVRGWRKRNKGRYKALPSFRYNQYKENAKHRSIEFDIPRELFDDLTSDFCFYCGEPPTPYNGIDRVDSEKGYFFGNVVSCCQACNYAKLTSSMEAYIDHCRQVVDWQARIVKVPEK